MASPSISMYGNSFKKSGAGFTLIEILITLGILTILAGVGLFMSMDVYRGYSFNYEKNVLVGVLQKARSESLANINQSAHGFYYDNSNYQYIIFQGNSYGENPSYDQIFPASKSVIVCDGNPCQVVFAQLSATTSPMDIKISGNGKESTIQINEEGRINW